MLAISYSIPRVGFKHIPILQLLVPSGCFSLIVLSGSMLAGEPTKTTRIITVLMFALILLAGNTKDIGDLVGDVYESRKTLPMVIGIKATCWLAFVTSLVVSVVAVVSVPLLRPHTAVLAVSIGGSFVLSAGSCYYVTGGDRSPRGVRKANKIQGIGATIILAAYILSHAHPP